MDLPDLLPGQRVILYDTEGPDGVLQLRSAIVGSIERATVRPPLSQTHAQGNELSIWDELESGIRSPDTVWAHVTTIDGTTNSDFILSLPIDMTFEEFLQDPRVQHG